MHAIPVEGRGYDARSAGEVVVPRRATGRVAVEIQIDDLGGTGSAVEAEGVRQGGRRLDGLRRGGRVTTGGAAQV